MGLQCRIPTFKEVENKVNFFKHISAEFFQETKSKLKEYIDMSTQLRQEANNTYEVNLYKLMNNSFFGKTFEDVGKYTDVKIVSHEKDIDRFSKKEQFKRWHIYK